MVRNSKIEYGKAMGMVGPVCFGGAGIWAWVERVNAETDTQAHLLHPGETLSLED